jgi:hypothetical protein
MQFCCCKQHGKLQKMALRVPYFRQHVSHRLRSGHPLNSCFGGS